MIQKEYKDVLERVKEVYLKENRRHDADATLRTAQATSPIVRTCY